VPRVWVETVHVERRLVCSLPCLILFLSSLPQPPSPSNLTPPVWGGQVTRLLVCLDLTVRGACVKVEKDSSLEKWWRPPIMELGFSVLSLDVCSVLVLFLSQLGL